MNGAEIVFAVKEQRHYILYVYMQFSYNLKELRNLDLQLAIIHLRE